jgi:outer membrane lipoprotein-sorting protein
MNRNTENQNHPELDGQLETAVWAVLSDPVPADAIDRVKQHARDAVQSKNEMTEPRPPVVKPAQVRVLLSLVVVAASALVVVSLFLTPPNAFAQVVEQIKQIRTATFTMESTGGRRSPDFVALASVKSPDRIRFDFKSPKQTVNITNNSSGELISYETDSDQVTVHEIPKADVGFDILQQLQNTDAKAVEINNENSVEGTDLYSIFDGRGRVWVDKNTKLPQRIEVTAPEELGETKIVYRDFQWNVPVDDTLFQIPEGRSIVHDSLLAEPTEAELIAAFRIRHAFSQAPYDTTFLTDEVGLRLGQLAYDLSKSRAENDEMQQAKLQDHFAKIGITVAESQAPALIQKRIDYLCMKLDQWEYQISRTGGWIGDGVRPGEPKALCWWKDGDQIRVLRGELTIVDADQPPLGK